MAKGTRKMRVLFCGLGGIGQRHLRNLRSLVPPDELELHAYRVVGRDQKLRDDLSVEVNRSLVEDYRIKVHTDLEEALAVGPQMVFICNPSSHHTHIATRAAEAGAHLFIEKPVAHVMDGLDNLLKILNENNLICYVGYNFRFHPALQRLKKILEERQLGNLLSAQFEIGEYLPHWHRYEDYRTMYASRSELGGGVILSQIHEMDLIYWLFGLPQSVYCLGGQLSHLEVDVEDVATSLMLSDGPLGRFPITLQQDFVQRPPVRDLKVVGDVGIAQIDLIRNELRVFGDDGELIERLDFGGFKRNDMFIAQMEHFLACVSGCVAPNVDLWDGMQSLKLALASKMSLRRQSPVLLQEIAV